MPTIYLSPSTQESNPYITGSGSEEYWMNRLADELEPYLRASAIAFTRNTPDMTAASSIRQANSRGGYDFYLALHSNASGSGATEGKQRGIIAFYYPGSREGERAANIFVDNFKAIYPLPQQVYARSTTAIGEVRQPNFPSVLLEIGYHDNVADARWIEGNLQPIAEVIALSLTEYFGIPFVTPITPWIGVVAVTHGTLNLRSYPSSTATLVADLPAGAEVTVYGQYDDWYVVHYAGRIGYAAARYIVRK
ncbi:MAG: N-acetylmuramoyl-L-alanine amidase [Oscillospiraceae bacterium]